MLEFEAWQKKFDKLERDFISFRAYYDRHKKCKCDIDGCRHFARALVQVLGVRIDALYNEVLGIKFTNMRRALR